MELSINFIGMVSILKNSIQNKLTQIHLEQKCFYKMFYVWDTASVFKRLQQEHFRCNRMKKSPRVPKALVHRQSE